MASALVGGPGWPACLPGRVAGHYTGSVLPNSCTGPSSYWPVARCTSLPVAWSNCRRTAWPQPAGPAAGLDAFANGQLATPSPRPAPGLPASDVASWEEEYMAELERLHSATGAYGPPPSAACQAGVASTCPAGDATLRRWDARQLLCCTLVLAEVSHEAVGMHRARPSPSGPGLLQWRQLLLVDPAPQPPPLHALNPHMQALVQRVNTSLPSTIPSCWTPIRSTRGVSCSSAACSQVRASGTGACCMKLGAWCMLPGSCCLIDRQGPRHKSQAHSHATVSESRLRKAGLPNGQPGAAPAVKELAAVRPCCTRHPQPLGSAPCCPSIPWRCRGGAGAGGRVPAQPGQRRGVAPVGHGAGGERR